MIATDTARAPVRDLRAAALLSIVAFAVLWHGLWHLSQAVAAVRVVLGVCAGLSFGVTMLISRSRLSRNAAFHVLAGYAGYAALTPWHELASRMGALGLMTGVAVFCLVVSSWHIWWARW